MKIAFGLSLIWAYWNLLILWSQPAKISAVDEPRLDWAEGTFISLVGLTVILGLASMILSLIGVYTLLTLTVILFCFSLIVFLFLGNVKPPRFSPVGIYETGLAFLLALCVPIYFQPHEYILGSADAGTYMNIGVNLAKTGKWVVDDAFSKWLSQYGLTTFYYSPSSLPVQWQFYGWYNHPTQSGLILPQFFPLHPCLISIGVLLYGVWGGLYVTPLWGLLGIAAVYFATRRLFNRPVAILAALFLALTPTQIFFSRYPTAEPLTLVFLFSGFLAYQHLYDEAQCSRWWGVFAGSTLGCALLTRIDLPLMVILVLLILGLIRIFGQWNKQWRTFAWVFLIFLSGSLSFGYFWGWIYIFNTYGVILKYYEWILVGTLIIFFLIASGFGLVVWVRKYPALRSNFRFASLKWLVGILILSLSLYAYFFRPIFNPPIYDTGPGNILMPQLDSLNWVRLGWYLTPLGLILSTLGLFFIILKEDLTRLVFFLSVGVLTIIQYTFKSLITPYHIYAMRRFFPLVIPVLIIFAAFSLYQAFKKWDRLIINLFVISVGLFFCLGLAYQSGHLFFLRDLKGVVSELELFSNKLSARSIILINDHDFADRIGVPLKYIHGFDVATIRQENELTLPFLIDLINRARQNNQIIYLLAANPLSESIRKHLIFDPLFIFPLKVKMLQNTFTNYPQIPAGGLLWDGDLQGLGGGPEYQSFPSLAGSVGNRPRWF